MSMIIKSNGSEIMKKSHLEEWKKRKLSGYYLEKYKKEILKELEECSVK